MDRLRSGFRDRYALPVHVCETEVPGYDVYLSVVSDTEGDIRWSRLPYPTYTLLGS